MHALSSANCIIPLVPGINDSYYPSKYKCTLLQFTKSSLFLFLFVSVCEVMSPSKFWGFINCVVVVLLRDYDQSKVGAHSYLITVFMYLLMLLLKLTDQVLAF